MHSSQDEHSIYAPIRERGHAYWHLARWAAETGAVTMDGRIASNLYELIEHSLIEPALHFIGAQIQAGEFPEEAAPSAVAKITSYNDFIPLAAQYEIAGRQIFDLHDKLTELLVQTDLGECTLEDLHMPYNAFYIRFGKQDHIRLPFDEGQWEYLDGAFVASAQWDDTGDRLKFGFTTAHEDGSGVQLPGYFFDLIPAERKLPVPEAIESALQRRTAKLAIQQGDSEFAAVLKESKQEENESSAEVLRAAASLLVNTLFYLESIRDAVPDATPGRDTPPERVASWYQSTGNKRRKQQSALTADGYAIVHLVGQEAVPTAAASSSSTIKVHWRRGHWRFQRYGEKLSLQRRIWIKPVLVGRDFATPDEELPGHIYVAGSSNRVQ